MRNGPEQMWEDQLGGYYSRVQLRDDGFLRWSDNSVQTENGEDLKSLFTGRMDRKEDLAMH